MSTSDEYCISEYNRHFKIIGGRFFVPVLRKEIDDSYPRLNSNLSQALNRNRTLQARFAKNKNLKTAYDQKIRKLLDDGIIARRGLLKDLWHRYDRIQQKGNEECLLPVTLVLDKQKLRLTLDSKNISNILHAGPNLIGDIFSLSIEFRLHPYWCTLDIHSMYFQIAY